MCNTAGIENFNITSTLGLNPNAFTIGPPKMPAPPPIPTRDDPAVKEAADKERKRRLKAKGRSSTILTGGQGVLEPANIGRKTLLGQ